MLEFMRFSAAIMFMSAAFYVFVLTMDKFEKVFLAKQANKPQEETLPTYITGEDLL